ncbi:hypothetical protein, partial [Streptomyces turgidiscabies]|uniref:hypothetical protein n=1 Tax=Streptomyces turgidiscabies TaxID=85558 RepID=UPI0038F6944A
PRYGAGRPDLDLPSATSADPALVPGVDDVQGRPVDAIGPHETGQAGYSWVVLRTGAENSTLCIYPVTVGAPVHVAHLWDEIRVDR